MKEPQLIRVLFAVVILLLICNAVVLLSCTTKDATGDPGRGGYEYDILGADSVRDMVSALDAAGAEGWHVVGYTFTGMGQHVAIIEKRR